MHAFLIASFYFFYFAIIAVYIIFMPKVLAMVGYAPSQIGIIFAAAPLVRFIVPFAFLRGLRLNHHIFNTALLLLFVSSVAFYPALHYFWPLFVANIGVGIGLSLILPYIEVIALGSVGKENYGKIRLFGSVGFILVALVLVKFLSSPEIAIFYLIAMVFATAFFGYIIARDDHHKTQTDNFEDHHGFNPFKHLWLWLGLLMMQVSFGPFYNFFTIYETAHGVSMDMTIYLWSFGVVIEIVMLYFQGPLLKRNLLNILLFSSFVTIFRWLLVDQFPDQILILFLSQSLHAFSFALMHSASIAYLFSLYTARRLAQQFYFGVAYGLGGFLGAFGSGYIYEWWPKHLFLSAAMVALASFIFLFLERRSLK